MLKNEKLIIVGIGETARLAYEYFTFDSEYNVIAFAVNQEYIKADKYFDLPVVSLDELRQHYNIKEYEIFVALGSGHLNRDRMKIYNEIKNIGYKCASYVSSKAFTWRDVEIGENCFILENNVLQSGVKIGNNVTLWSGNHIWHMTEIQDNCFISSHCVISGFCNIGKNCFLGVNSTFVDNINIADDNFIGLGTIINKNTEENSVYTGNPAEKSKVSAKRLCKVKDWYYYEIWEKRFNLLS